MAHSKMKREQTRRMLEEGKSRKDIAWIVEISKTTVAFWDLEFQIEDWRADCAELRSKLEEKDRTLRGARGSIRDLQNRRFDGSAAFCLAAGIGLLAGALGFVLAHDFTGWLH